MKWVKEMKNVFYQTKKENLVKQNQKSFEENHLIIRSLVHNYKDAACYFDYKGDVLIYNTKISEMIGLNYEDGAVLQQMFTHLYKHFDPEVSMDCSPQLAEDIMTHQNGNCFPINIVHTPLFFDGKMVGTFCSVSPKMEIINESENPKNNLKREYQNYLNRLGVALFSVNTAGKYMEYITDAIEDIYEISKDEVTIDTWQRITHPDDYEEVQMRFSKLLKGETFTHNFRIMTLNGNYKWIKAKAIAVKSEEGQVTSVIGTIEDYTEIMELQKKLERRAYTDVLTQLPNRFSGREYIKHLIEDYSAKNKTFALILLNLDGFNRVNEVFGHDIGDETLKRIANKVNNAIKDRGYLCRVSGDEYLVVMHEQVNINGYYQSAKDLLQQIEEPLNINDYNIHLTASIGVSIFPTDGGNNETLTNRASKALRCAKQLGIGEVQLFSSSMNIETLKSFQIENDLRNAIENNEFYLEYQPIIDVYTQKAVGAEALIRWKHPVWGKISPGEFIPIAENSPIIQDISEFVIKEVYRQTAEWMKEGVKFNHISFNLSPKNFLKNNLFNIIKTNVEKYNIPQDVMKIEITEGLLLRETNVVRDQIEKLKAIGVNIALDDYGVGYSSINYLKQYPIDTLKIDKSFIRHIEEESVDSVVVQSIIDLAKGLGRKVVAEGVENRVQFDMLKKMRCDFIQGYLFGKPVSENKMKEIFNLEKVHPTVTNNQVSVERRKYFRVNLPYPLRAEMTILSINQKKVTLGETETLIQDIGLGGLKFISHLQLMPEAEILYEFKTTLLENPLTLHGKVVWRGERAQEIFEYGVEFSIDEYERDHLATILNKLSTKLRTNPEFIDDQFIKQQAISYIRNQHFKDM
ncbi:EAL domain-containing protein [Halalkalibacillus sediminis]|nr:EAL domain-containing protein [Halalkalibacillus sediminis]